MLFILLQLWPYRANFKFGLNFQLFLRLVWCVYYWGDCKYNWWKFVGTPRVLSKLYYHGTVIKSASSIYLHSKHLSKSISWNSFKFSKVRLKIICRKKHSLESFLIDYLLVRKFYPIKVKSY